MLARRVTTSGQPGTTWGTCTDTVATIDVPSALTPAETQPTAGVGHELGHRRLADTGAGGVASGRRRAVGRRVVGQLGGVVPQRRLHRHEHEQQDERREQHHLEAHLTSVTASARRAISP